MNRRKMKRLLASATTPILQLTNGDPDRALRRAGAASNHAPIIFQVALPPDLDDTAAVEVHLRPLQLGHVAGPQPSFEREYYHAPLMQRKLSQERFSLLPGDKSDAFLFVGDLF